MEHLRGVVERLTYSNEETGYSVIKAKVKGYAELVAIVGSMAGVNVGSVLSVKGEWTHDAKYGRQFVAKEWEETLPASIYGMEKYLGSGLIKGIGPKYAKQIVSMFKEDTLRVIEEEPDILIGVNGIGHKRVRMIKTAWQEQKEIKNIMLFLQDHDVSTAFGSRIFKAYGNESVNTIKDNPFRLADDVWGIGFITADRIAEKLGYDKESYARCRAGIFYVLNRFADDGHCFAQTEPLIKKCVDMLNIEEPKLVMTFDYLIKHGELIGEEDRVYLPPFFYSESGTARRLAKIVRSGREKAVVNPNGFIAGIEQSQGIKLDDMQARAVRLAAENKVCVLTGGPGTGKTTVTRGIIEVFRASGYKILLAAPTGRAAKRLSELTEMEAKTIHRLLECKPPDGYKRTEEQPLEGDALIVDEASMIDIILMYNLLKAVPDHMSVVFVGDTDQLPSVGAGNVLKDIIASGVVPVVTLNKIFRQALNSRIIVNAHRIKDGKPPILKNDNRDFFFIETDAVVDKIKSLCGARLPKYFGVSKSDIQVLTPMQRGEAGARNLNIVLQDALNPQQTCLRRGAVEFRPGDKVMQIKNNYDKEVFNGDTGTVKSVNLEDHTLTAAFEDREIQYDHLELDELVLAYATTIHKAQGSEYPVVVMPVTMSHYVMLQRNLLYTGVTRAKKGVVIVGEAKAIYVAVKSNEVIERNTRLAERLKATCSGLIQDDAEALTRNL